MEWTRGGVIGCGSSGVVSVATFHSSGEVFAVKSVELSRSKWLRREQRILSVLRSVHVIGYGGSNVTFENGKAMYNLFMEYAAGGTLKQRGGLGEPMIRAYTRAILEGLHYLHSNCIVHCDIKSENILITGDGVKIGDLGCARLGGEFSGSVCGTPAFMAPEVARGEEQGFAADVWALGCTVIEMATGRPPWGDVSDPVSAVYRIGFSGEVPEIPGWMSEEAKEFLEKCLTRDPEKRWSVFELLAHPFAAKATVLPNIPTSSSPTSVLHQSFWNSSIHQLNSIHNKSLNSPMERIQALANSNSNHSPPNWIWDENWVTVRSATMEEEEEAEEEEEEEVVSEAATSQGQGHGMADSTEPTRISVMGSDYDENYNCCSDFLCGNFNFDKPENFVQFLILWKFLSCKSTPQVIFIRGHDSKKWKSIHPQPNFSSKLEIFNPTPASN